MFARGLLDVRGLQAILTEVTVVALKHRVCNLLIDLLDADCNFQLEEVVHLVPDDRPAMPSPNSTVALLSAPGQVKCSQMAMLSTLIAEGGFRVEVFDDPKAAVRWFVAEV
jgi:hypothetical protein